MTFATDGIVTRIHEVGAGDKLINIITPDRGRIGVMVKGSRSPSSKLASISQLFTYGNYEIYEKNRMYWLRGGSITNTFYELSSDISRVALATYFCDVANELTDEDEPCEELLRLLLNSLYLTGRGERDQAIIKSAFELRMAVISGYLPELSGCVYCGDDLPDMSYLDVMGGRLICSDCLSNKGKGKPHVSKNFDDVPEASVLCGLSPSVLTALRYITVMPQNKIFSFEIKDKDELYALSKATEDYLVNHLGRGFDSLEFYKAVK